MSKQADKNSQTTLEVGRECETEEKSSPEGSDLKPDPDSLSEQKSESEPVAVAKTSSGEALPTPAYLVTPLNWHGDLDCSAKVGSGAIFAEPPTSGKTPLFLSSEIMYSEFICDIKSYIRLSRQAVGQKSLNSEPSFINIYIK